MTERVAHRLSVAPEDSDLTSSVTYDEWGRRSQVFDPDRGISRYTYTEEGQPLCDTDPDGLTICRSYDTYGRLLSVTRQSDGKILSQYFYDETESTLGTGRLTSVKDESGTRRMHYDALTGKPARIERTYNALGNEKQFDIENTYDEAGALVKRTFPSVNISLRYDYHAGGPLATMQIEDPDHRILSSGSVLDVVRTSIPDVLGNIGTITYGNGVVIQSRYSTTGVLQQVTTQGNAPLSDYTYRWNDEGMLVEKQDLLMADGINRSEQFTYDTSRRLVEATGPYGDRNTPHRTLQYAYGVDGQPIVADEKVYNYDVSNPHRLKSFNQRSYAYDNDTTPDKNKGLVVERRAPGNVVSRFQYHWTGRIKQAQTINGGTVTTVDYEYDTEGNRFIKRTDLGGIVTEIHDLSSDYRVYADGSSEVHTIEIRNGNDPVARFRFQDNHHNSGVWAPSSLFGHRLGADLLRIASLEGGITKLPSLLGFAFSDAYYAVKLLPQIQNKARLLVFLYWNLASLIALAALVLLVRAWRRSPDEGPGLLPVGVYRFGSVLALLSFSATGCIVVPQTQDGSEYLLAANGLFRGTSEGGESSIMSVLGAVYYVSTHNGSTDIVTNADGAPVARFVYEPFGKLNSDLTDLDPDRNGVHYGEQFQFTGQEYEPETGLYNYKARIYDPETARFLQPDPVHTEQPGQDNWDRYQYVWNNPVNFVDPTGMSSNYVHMFNQIMKNALGGYSYVAKRTKQFVDRISKGKKHNDPTDSINVTGRKIREFGTGTRHMFSSWGKFAGFWTGVFDYVFSLVNNAFTGRPAPYLTYHHGGFMVHNSVFADWFSSGRSFVLGNTGHLATGASKGVMKHEAGHMLQGSGGGFDFQNHNGFAGTEYGADFNAGVFNYGATPYLYYLLGGAEAVRGVALVSIVFYGGRDLDQSLRAYSFFLSPELGNPLGNAYNSLYFLYSIQQDWGNLL